jgi:16S rRNA processing protein RimM
VRGEVRVALDTDHPEHLAPPLTVYLGADHRPYAIEQARLDKGDALLKLEGFESREQADALRGLEVAIRADEATPLGPGEFYVHQVIGLQVYTDEGKRLGRVVEILETGANDVYVVHGPTGEILIPAIRDVVLDIDTAAGRILVRPLEGMI